MFYQVDWRSLWRFPVCGVLVVVGIGLILLGGLAGGNPLLLLAGLGCALGGMLLHRHLAKQEDRRSPIMQVRAKVLYQTQGKEQGGKYISNIWFLTFETEQGETLEFEVSELDCRRWETGDEAVLRYRGGEFLSFGRGLLTEEVAKEDPHARG